MFSYSSSRPSLVCRHVLFGFAPRELRSLPKVFIYVLNVCKFFIWHSRNDLRFQGVRPGAPHLIAKLRSRVGFHLSLLFKRYKSLRRRRIFHRRWGAAGTIGSIVDDRSILSSFYVRDFCSGVSPNSQDSGTVSGEPSVSPMDESVDQ